MDKKIQKKLSALDPGFRKKINDLFESINQSVSMLYDVATHDEKTGLYNNKFFETVLDMEMEKAKRGQQKLSLVMIDIDFFKKINDTYGHGKGDEILNKLAKVINVTIRKSDIAARFGGEEFMILLPETDLEKAKQFALRLRKNVKSDKFLKKYSLTVSGGVTQYKEKDTKKKFRDRVDRALYHAKETGRDKFVSVK
ncbi:GGDEF domain-containing protein [Candidatus Pacearchaeota archaeon]|jgi:diguanylate cyclase (GGDEF)-like protein|nr:GGDEF domain-containing protein [Candidatus Pacearchaeota archaeon]